MAKEIVIHDFSAPYLDLWINDPSESVSKAPGWVKIINSSGGESSAMRIVSTKNDSGLKKVRVKRSNNMATRLLLQNGPSLARVGNSSSLQESEEQTNSSDYKDDFSSSSSAMEWKNIYWLPIALIVGYLVYHFGFKK